MSNIVYEDQRRLFCEEMIQNLSIVSFAEAGFYRCQTLEWAVHQVPHVYACDSSADLLEPARRMVPSAQLTIADSITWLQEIAPPEPVFIYLDTDWTGRGADVRAAECECIFSRFGKFVIMANSVFQEDHPNAVYKKNRVSAFHRQFKDHCRQFLIPLYKHPVLQAGFVVMNHCDTDIEFSTELFADIRNQP